MTTIDALCQAFRDPETQQELFLGAAGLVNAKGRLYKFATDTDRVIDFIEPVAKTDADALNLQAYDDQLSTEIYRNFLNWLFATFGVGEREFRLGLIDRLALQPGMKVLVVGVGLGEDLPLILEKIGQDGELHAQDISKSMVLHANAASVADNVFFSVSNATSLPYQARYFDVVFHFGGINLFGDLKKAIDELERVCKIGGRVLFGDEGIASHLRGTDYADILINNNQLWARHAPLDILPANVEDISLRYVLGNCFYLIAFSPSEGLPHVDLDVPHAGTRGGTARTRWFGKIEGVTEATKLRLVATAKGRGMSLHALLEEIIHTHTSADNAPLD